MNFSSQSQGKNELKFTFFLTGNARRLYLENMDNNSKTRIPRQERGKETKERILNAGRKLFSEKGFYKTNSKEIAREAGVSIGAFYVYFKDKKGLFKELLIDYHRKIKHVLTTIDIESFIQADARKDFLRYLVDKLIESHDIYPRFHQEVHAMAQSDPEFSQIMEMSKTESLRVTKSILSTWKDQLRVKNIDAAAVVVQTSTEEIVHAVLFSSNKVQVKKIIEELTDMLYCYLFRE